MGHKLRVKPIGEKSHEVYLDEKKISVKKLGLSMEPMRTDIDLEINGEPELEVLGDVTIDFSPRTVKSAVMVIKNALKKNDFVAYMGMDELMRLMNDR